MAPCSGIDTSHLGGYQNHETPQALPFTHIIDRIQGDAAALPTGIARTCTWTLLRAACAITALSLALLAGCAAPNEVCATRGGFLVSSAYSESWDSEGQRRAAIAIECDAQEIRYRISTVDSSAADVTALDNRERDL